MQISHKKSYPDFSHGNVLYAALASYLKNTEDKENVTVFETGTAKGFSAVCMAKALDDIGRVSGKIVTFDIIPHDVVMYWNSVNDHLRGPVTRRSLLVKWGDLVDNYVIFIEGDSWLMMNKVHTGRVNFAFLDGGHTYDDVCFEFSCIQDKQRSGDIIICDDYNVVEFPGIVNAVDEMCEIGGYSKDIVSLTGNRKLAVCEKGRD